MTDSHDPFAANPYTPPTDRDGADASPTAATPPADAPQAPAAPAPAAPAPAGHAEPTVEVPAQEATPPAPPVPPVHAQPADQAQPVQAQPTPPADDYTHRYASSTDPSAAPTPQAGHAAPPAAPHGDPFRGHEPTVAFAAAGGAYGAGPGGHDGGAVAAAPAPRRRGRTAVGALAFLVLAAGAGYGGAYAFDQQDDGGGNGTTVSSLDSTNKATQTNAPAGTVEQVANKVLPSVVQINVKGGQESGSGTGIIISSDGEILTNNHVVAVAGDSGTITVAFNDGTNAKAEIIGTDPKTDLAVIKADGKSGLTPATLGSSSTLKVGQEVVAIGSPFGLESTVTQGIVSALNRPVSSSDGSGGDRTTFPAVQTDAAINPGNSGGPLVDLQGRVIAINSAIRSGGSTSGEAGSIGLGFAIPIDLAKNVSKQLLAGKTVSHAQIGVTVDNFLGPDGITGIGAQVKEITPDGAGDKAGLKQGDVITAINGALVPSSEALVAAVRGFNPGEKVTVSYTRGSQKDETDVTLGSDGGATSQ
ncbi:S1C family serine protease [Aeromicrobium fastidiosum]|uniref:Trypsin-like serine protease n=1 Tax=Aeromicrobium fastidiosum TaxID=52699 RepID=A0A641AT28_9ACTN|nr:trypsin-like peptidase domain-containing protein [Aeromicrobium fastidiosum]KAA1380211.1 trypsin-like serine protease [Aeromicrobium fastidiosum]MBP2389761.1 putative serine protease PepD [Aeromicrobium fastidiosum]